MSPILLLSLLLQIIITSSQTQSGVAQTYFIDVYKSIDASHNGNNPYSATPYEPLPDYPYVAYAMNRCVRDGNDAATGGTQAQFVQFQCSKAGGIANRCTWAGDSECGGASRPDCTDGTQGAASYNFATNTMTYGGGTCAPGCAVGSLCHNSITQYYMEIGYYKAFYESNTGCPATQFNATTILGYQYAGANRLATGVCVKQDDNKYVLAKCDLTTGEIGLYNNAACTQKIQTLISYSTACEYFDNPDGLFNSFRYFRRLEGCYVNGNDIQVPTPSPTFEPTLGPSKSPTRNPTQKPIVVPTESPTTPFPSRSPTLNPSRAPTIPPPTTSPTLKPTNPPTTKYPTRSKIDQPTRTVSPTPAPTFSPTDEDKIEAIQDKVKGLGMMEIGIIVAVVVGIIICCVICCWYKKRKLKEISATHGMNRAAKQQATRQRNQQRKMELMRKKQQKKQMVRQLSPSADGQTLMTTV